MRRRRLPRHGQCVVSGLTWLGAFLLALPYLALFAAIVRRDGRDVALIVHGITAVAPAVIVAGAVLLSTAT